ncbi:hypothetical protein [Pseudolabrys sp.]|uniref:hypothetical protein n=1 Tax=Pseudolabrys sp. TaxID=1960880 RepID=UPI003D1467CE
MTATRFVTAQTSQTDAINAVADLANQNGQASIVAKSGATTTLTAAEMVNTVIQQSGTNGALSVATATAAALVAALKNAQANSVFDMAILNTNDNTVTLTAGDGVTLSGTTAVPTNKSQIYRGIVTNAASGSEAVTLVGLLKAPV